MPPPKNEAVKCNLIIRDADPSIYALPTDGKKWKMLQFNRRALAVQLASFADSDGTSIRVGTSRLAAALGWSRAKLFRGLDELKQLGFLINDGKTSERGTAVRLLNLDAVLAKVSDRAAKVSDTPSQRLRYTEPTSQEAQPTSQEAQPTSHPRRDPTNPNRNKPTNQTGKALVGELEDLFEKQTGRKFKRHPTGEQIRDTTNLGSREKVIAAWKAYLIEAPFDEDTWYPLAAFIKNFAGYVKKEPLTGKEPELQAAFAAQDKIYSERHGVKSAADRAADRKNRKELKDVI